MADYVLGSPLPRRLISRRPHWRTWFQLSVARRARKPPHPRRSLLRAASCPAGRVTCRADLSGYPGLAGVPPSLGAGLLRVVDSLWPPGGAHNARKTARAPEERACFPPGSRRRHGGGVGRWFGSWRASCLTGGEGAPTRFTLVAVCSPFVTSPPAVKLAGAPSAH